MISFMQLEILLSFEIFKMEILIVGYHRRPESTNTISVCVSDQNSHQMVFYGCSL